MHDPERLTAVIEPPLKVATVVGVENAPVLSDSTITVMDVPAVPNRCRAP